MWPLPSSVGSGMAMRQISVTRGQREANGQPRLSAVHIGMSVARRAVWPVIFLVGIGHGLDQQLRIGMLRRRR